jgi:hypothetical protein
MDRRIPRFCEADHNVAFKLHGRSARRQTAEKLAKFAKRIKAAKGEWRMFDQVRKAPCEAARKAKAGASD